MSSLALFMKENKEKRESVKYVATKSLKDENGNPLEWTVRPITTEEVESIREECTVEVPVPGKPNMYRQKFKSKEFARKLLVHSVEFPDLYNKELQDSYGVMDPEILITKMVDNPGEYDEFTAFVQKFNNYSELDSEVETAKNSSTKTVNQQ